MIKTQQQQKTPNCKGQKKKPLPNHARKAQEGEDYRGRIREGRGVHSPAYRAGEHFDIQRGAAEFHLEWKRSLIGVLNQGHRLPIENRAQDERTYRRGESTVNGDEKRSEGRAIERNRIFSVEEECDQSEGEFLGWNEE